MAELAGIDDAERNRLAVVTALNVLRRHDSAVERILCSASHVIVYELERTSKKAAPRWKHTDIHGVLHVIERKGDPRFRFLVMNRKGIDNLVENLIPGEVELEFSDKLIMYKKTSGRVRSIWFYDSEEYEKARAVIGSIAEGSVGGIYRIIGSLTEGTCVFRDDNCENTRSCLLLPSIHTSVSLSPSPVHSRTRTWTLSENPILQILLTTRAAT
mmetsp:Transcript_39229/g.155619  ORF Transcript_39229/g.155619 Transcript_39229/m.155619 type:complete len:214 (+) Transcript_39229:90-731(+)